MSVELGLGVEGPGAVVLWTGEWLHLVVHQDVHLQFAQQQVG